MTTIAEIMSPSPQVIGPEASLHRAAELMRDLDVGALPVCNGKRLLGMVTDRDITVRGVASGLSPDQACVSDVMTLDVQWCTEEQDSEDVMRLMGQAQVRRVPVINAERELVGIVSLGDLATRHGGPTETALREISEPGPRTLARP
jgi:CBS domain-containing protein